MELLKLILAGFFVYLFLSWFIKGIVIEAIREEKKSRERDENEATELGVLLEVNELTTKYKWLRKVIDLVAIIIGIILFFIIKLLLTS